MLINRDILIGLRLKNGISRAEFAKSLGISYSHLQKIETGLRKPSLELLKNISRNTGIPAGGLLDADFPVEMKDAPDKTPDLIELIFDLNRERYSIKILKSRISELEKMRDHILAVNALQERFIVILKQEKSPVEQGKKVAALARTAIRAGEIRFDEVQAALHLKRRTLKQWLESEKGEYRCKLFDERSVIAATPMEAGMKLRCFDCDVRETEDCRGYGDNNYPENLFILIALMDANGIHNREEQVQLLYDSFGIDITAHQLSEALSRQKNGKRVSENLVNLRPLSRKKALK